MQNRWRFIISRKNHRNKAVMRFKQSFADSPRFLFAMLGLVVPQLCFASEPANVQTFPLQIAGNSSPGFTMIPPSQLGITFSNSVAVHSIHTLIASGLAAGDVDGDGLCDLYFCASDGNNVLYRNLGNWRFEDITKSAGVGCGGQHSIGATFADVNGDGALDLVVAAGFGGGPRVASRKRCRSDNSILRV